ncbi:hypothetical protein FITA111629_14365 [Filibacter tadaridae]|uniref:Uncharacterized protein n=1 Tax=Filibacter tadaridae TaxID=2483811 RepID=A0A3P5X6S1_9BACL|nr:hypothetical protein [Filibacter tadaridae]VDC24007.1 hypothetical protein FILTAD_00972 [Filibacter tadaridae]
MDMSLFFEDEIRKVMQKVTPTDLSNLHAQDPRGKPDWADRNPSHSFGRQLTPKNHRDFRQRPTD